MLHGNIDDHYYLHNPILAVSLKKGEGWATPQSTFVQVRKGIFSSDTLLDTIWQIPSARKWFSCRNKSTRISAVRVPHGILPCAMQSHSKNPQLRAPRNARALASPLLRRSAKSPQCEWWPFETSGDGRIQAMFDMESLDSIGGSGWKCCHMNMNKPEMKAPKGLSWQLRRQLWVRSGGRRCARTGRCHPSWPHSQINT